MIEALSTRPSNTRRQNKTRNNTTQGIKKYCSKYFLNQLNSLLTWCRLSRGSARYQCQAAAKRIAQGKWEKLHRGRVNKVMDSCFEDATLNNWLCEVSVTLTVAKISVHSQHLMYIQIQLLINIQIQLLICIQIQILIHPNPNSNIQKRWRIENRWCTAWIERFFKKSGIRIKYKGPVSFGVFLAYPPFSGVF